MTDDHARTFTQMGDDDPALAAEGGVSTEERLRAAETIVINVLSDDPRYIKFVALGPDHFRNPRVLADYHRVLERAKGPLPDGRLYNGRIRRLQEEARLLIEAAPMRPPWDEPPPAISSPAEAAPARANGAEADRRLRTKQRLQPRQEVWQRPGGQPSADVSASWRKRRVRDLRIVMKYLTREPRLTMISIAALFPGRDVNDPDVVGRIELGRALKLCMDEMFTVEDAAIAYGRAEGWTIKSRKRQGEQRPYTFAFQTITCYDADEDEVKAERKRRANGRAAEKRRTKRAERTMQQQQPQPQRFETHADAIAATAANARAQEQALLDAIGPEGMTMSELMEKVDGHSAWATIAGGNRGSFRTIVSRRLDKLRTDGTIKDEYRGARRERVVYRV